MGLSSLQGGFEFLGGRACFCLGLEVRIMARTERIEHASACLRGLAVW